MGAIPDSMLLLFRFIGHLVNIFYLHTIKFTKSAVYHAYLFKLFNKQFHGLNLGSGSAKIPKFCNIDANPLSICDVIAQIEKIKLKSNSARVIYSSHVFEHIPREQAQKTLAEWFRVLKPGGKLYISVPDMEVLFNIYLDNLPYYHTEKGRYLVDRACFCVYGAERGKYDLHFNGYSFTTLEHLLESVGFQNVQRFDRSELKIIPFYDTSLQPFIEEHAVATVGDTTDTLLSLNVEALK